MGPDISRGIRIRAAVESDVGQILVFIRELAMYERLADRVTANEEDLRKFLFGRHTYAESLIAELDGKAAGFALFFHNFSTFLARPGIYLEDLYIRESSRGHGLGLALLTRIAQIGVERGCARVDWAVLDWNTPAIEFYDRIGAKPESDWKVYRLSGEALAALARRQLSNRP